MTDPNDYLLSERDVAAVLAVKPSAVESWRRKGTGPEWIRVGRLVRYRRSAVERYLAENTVSPEAA